MNFSQWLESIQDKSGIVKQWLANVPSSSVQITSGILEFAETMAEPKLNMKALDYLLRGVKFSPRLIYGPKEICGNLLRIESSLLRNALGLVVGIKKDVKFGFVINGEMSGNIVIAMFPFVYAKEDKKILASIITHELRHAVDYAKADGKLGRITQASMDLDAYYKSIIEARAYADQLMWLLQSMNGDINAVLEAFRVTKFKPLDQDFLECAKNFLEQIVIMPRERTQEDNKLGKQAAELLYKICETMQFSRFVHK